MCADTKTLRVDWPSDWEARGQPLSQSQSISGKVLQLSVGKEQNGEKRRGQAC